MTVDDETGEVTESYQFEETLTSADVIETKTIYWKNYPWIRKGTTVYLGGNVYMAEESYE